MAFSLHFLFFPLRTCAPPCALNAPPHLATNAPPRRPGGRGDRSGKIHDRAHADGASALARSLAHPFLNPLSIFLQVHVLEAIASATTTLATSTLRGGSGASYDAVGTVNDCGDNQLGADLAADAVCLAALRASGCVEVTSSEECTEEKDAGGRGYSVAFDPLDGSSIVSAGWAVGAIFGVWPGRGLGGRPGRDQAAAAYALLGSRTLLVIARPAAPPRTP